MTHNCSAYNDVLNVVHGYTFAVDEKDLTLIRDSFHADARILAFGSEFDLDQYCSGIPNIIEKMTTVHMIANEYVEIEDDLATCKSYVYAYHSVPGNLRDPGVAAIFGDVKEDTDSLILGKYVDELEKRNGVWRIKKKTITMIWQQHLKTLPPFPGWASM